MNAVLVVQLITAYLAVGLVCALPFAVLVQRLEPSARDASPLFRVLIVPGAVLLWPVILRRAARSLRRVP